MSSPQGSEEVSKINFSAEKHSSDEVIPWDEFKITIRPATLKEVGDLSLLGYQFYLESGYAESTDFDIKSVTNAMSIITTQDRYVMLVAQHPQGALVGMLAVALDVLLFNHQIVTANELFWWVDKQYRSSGVGWLLLEEIEKEAKNRGATILFMRSLETVKPKVMDRFYKQHGYRVNEHSYMKEL